MSKEPFLFNEFDAQTAKTWKQKIQVDLKGEPYSNLLWNTLDGIDVKPFYTEEDRITIKNTTSFSFKICQAFFIKDIKKTIFLALKAIENGVTSLQFTASEKFDYKALFKNIPKDKNIEIQLQLQFLDASFYTEITSYLSAFTIFLNVDIIGNLVKTGNWFSSLKNDHQALETILKNNSKNSIPLAVNTQIYQNAGATNTQQVAYALAHANEYLNYFGKDIANSIQFHFATGNNYFFEIAKLRAFRICWNALLDIYDNASEAIIFTQSSNRNKTLYDYNVNMLRTTTESMSAVLGGANTICNSAYDAIYHKKNAFGERIAKNQLLILQEESYFKEASTFADGAYYIESLSNQIAEKALIIFKDIEKNGGFLKQLKAGTIQRKIAEKAKKEQDLFNTEAFVLVGTNKYIHNSDKMKDELELYPFVRTNPTKTIIQPIIAKRLAEKTEQERLKNE